VTIPGVSDPFYGCTDSSASPRFGVDFGGERDLSCGALLPVDLTREMPTVTFRGGADIEDVDLYMVLVRLYAPAFSQDHMPQTTDHSNDDQITTTLPHYHTHTIATPPPPFFFCTVADVWFAVCHRVTDASPR
jgi:hypothetical protein